MNSGPDETTRSEGPKSTASSLPDGQRDVAVAATSRTSGRGLRPWFLSLKLLGLVLFLGGLAASCALLSLGREPADQAQWQSLRDSMRSVFYPCIFAGLILTVAAGAALFSRLPRHFLALRWFRAKIIIFVIAAPVLHFTSRGMVLDFYAAIEQGRLGDASDLRGRIAIAYGIGLITMFGLALLGRNKPRLGEPYGTRSGVQSHASRREDQVGASPSTAP